MHAQQALPEVYQGFNGRTVGEVEIAAPASANLDALRPLIQQKTGQPFSMDAVQQSVAAIQQLHQFSQVQVSIDSQASGLRVLFILQPADYIGILSFPGAGRFSYAQLLQAANLPDQSPYVAAELSQAVDGVTKFLASNGYFVAEVEPDVQRDEPHRLVNVNFYVDAGPRAKIGSIDIDGVPPAQADQVRRGLNSWWQRLKRSSLKVGQKYSKNRLNKAVGNIRNMLTKNGRLAPAVRLQPSAYEKDSNQAAIHFQVQLGPEISVKTEGAGVSQGTLRKIIPVFSEGAADQDLIDEGRRNLMYYFESKGFYDVTVDSQVMRGDDRVDVVYQVNQGMHHRVQGLAFAGNRFFSNDQLAAQTQIKKGTNWLVHRGVGKYSSDLLRKSVDSITALYKNAGFSSVTVTPEVRDVQPAVFVTFQIVEGPRDIVDKLQIVNAQGQPVEAATVTRSLNLGAGKPYSQRLVEQDRDQVLASFLDRGYLNATFDAKATPVAGDPHSWDVVYTADSGVQTDVGNIVYLGNRVTNPKFIRSVTAPNVRENRPISTTRFLTVESDLFGLGTFDWADVHTLRPIVDQTSEEVVVGVHESRRNTVEFGVGIEGVPRSGNIPVGSVALPGLPPIGLGHFTTSQENFFGPRGSIELDRRNIRGRAETASLALIASRLDQRASLTYSVPRLYGTSWSSLVGFSVERNTENPIFTAALGQASWQVQTPLNRRKTENLIVRYSYQRTDLSNIVIPDLVLPQDQRVRVSTVSTEFIRDTRDKPLDAHRGLYQTLDFGVTPRLLGSSADFVRFFGQNAVYVPVRPWLVWATNVRFGLAAPYNGSDVPLSERFFTGGADSLRGFPINGAGPQRPVEVCSSGTTDCTLISVPVGGDMLFILNTELRYPLPIPISFLKNSLGGAVFYDGGNVYSSASFRQLLDNYTHSVGTGFRYQTPVGPIRLDVGYRLTDVPGVKRTQFFVTIGQSF